MSHRWDRDSLFSSGALTVADFLDRVPGLMSQRARFYMAPQVGAYNGDVGAVRLFFDGVELEPLEPRSGGVVDLSQFPIATLEQLVVERGANELRIHMRSWRGPLRLTAQTRADVYTGDNRSNTFRGYLARRARNGVAFQAMLQQRSTDDRQLGGDGDATTVFTRLGVVRPRWSIDGTLLRVRSTQQPLLLLNVPSFLAVGRAIPRYDQVQQDAYVRVAAGNVARGPWLQLLAASRKNTENSPAQAANPARGFAADSADTTSSSAQYVATVGWSSERLRVSVTERLRRVNGETLHQPSARIGLDLGALAVSGYVERDPFDDVARGDVMARFQPVGRVALTGALSYGSTGTGRLAADSIGRIAEVALPRAAAARVEAAIRVRELWLQGGVVVRDNTVLRAPRLFDRSTPIVSDERAVGATMLLVGPLFRGLSVHVHGIQWSDAGWYRPQTQVRSELTWRYHWSGKTATGGFDFLLAGQAEYYSRSFLPNRSTGGQLIELPTFAATPLGLRAEFTIKDATISVQLRNVLNAPYTTVPGLLMPGPLTVYGVRWTFWN